MACMRTTEMARVLPRLTLALLLTEVQAPRQAVPASAFEAAQRGFDLIFSDLHPGSYLLRVEVTATINDKPLYMMESGGEGRGRWRGPWSVARTAVGESAVGGGKSCGGRALWAVASAASAVGSANAAVGER